MLPRILAKRPALANAPSEEVCQCLATVFASAACAYVPCILQPELAGHWTALLEVGGDETSLWMSRYGCSSDPQVSANRVFRKVVRLETLSVIMPHWSQCLVSRYTATRKYSIHDMKIFHFMMENFSILRRSIRRERYVRNSGVLQPGLACRGSG